MDQLAPPQLSAARRRPRADLSVLCLCLAATLLVSTVVFARTALSQSFVVSRVIDSSNLHVTIRHGEFRGHWSVRLSTPAVDARRGSGGTITAQRSTFVDGSGPATVSFKGSDEELQAVVARIDQLPDAR